MSNSDAEKKQYSRDDLRTRLLSTHKPDSKVVEVFGVELELRQPTLREVMRLNEAPSSEERAADMVVNYAFVPGTNERIFEEADRETILSWPYGPDLKRLQDAVTSLLGITAEDTERELRKDPLDSKPTE